MCYDQEKTQVPGAGELHSRFERLNQKDAYEQTECARPVSDSEILTQLFTYHPPTPVTLPKFAAINQAAKNFAEVVLQNCVRGADRAKAIEMIQDARMVANRSIATNGLSLA
jgi:hypothetical protein